VASAVDALSLTTGKCAAHAAERIARAKAQSDASPGAKEAAAFELAEARGDLARATESAAEHAAFYALAQATAAAEHSAAEAAVEGDAVATAAHAAKKGKPLRAPGRASGIFSGNGGASALHGKSSGPNDEHLEDL